MDAIKPKFHSESAAIELRSGKCRVIQVTWDDTAGIDTLDYYHAAFEVDGRWNAEFYDIDGSAVAARGSEETLEFEWERCPAASENLEKFSKSELLDGIEVEVVDVDVDEVPLGALCQTVDERDNGIPRHWKHWRII